MGQSFVQVPTDGAGKKIDTQVTATAAQHRQAMCVGDKSVDANIAPVDATKGLAVDLTNTGQNATKLLVTPDLPSGASTAAKQPALGTAGTASSDVITVQGIASMTKLLVTPDSVALPANQSVNVAQVAGTNTVTGGVAGIIAVGGNVANAGTATANPVPVGGVFTTTPATLTTGQTATAQFTAAQNLKQDISTIAGTAPTTAGKIDVKGADGDVFVRQATASNLNAAVVGTGTAGSPAGNILTVQGVASMTKLLVTPDALPANQSVNVAQVAGTNTVTGGAAGVIGIGGNNASGASITQNPVVEGMQAITALPTAVSNAQNVAASGDKFGRQVVLVASIRDLTGTQTTTISASTSETTIVTAAASTFNDLVMLIVSNTSASTNTRIDFRDTTGGTVLFSLQSIGGAAPVGFALPVPIPQTTVNTNWTAQCATSTTDIRIYAVFVKNK